MSSEKQFQNWLANATDHIDDLIDSGHIQFSSQNAENDLIAFLAILIDRCSGGLAEKPADETTH